MTADYINKWENITLQWKYESQWRYRGVFGKYYKSIKTKRNNNVYIKIFKRQLIFN